MNPDHIYEAGLNKNRANYTPLSPLSFLERDSFNLPNSRLYRLW